MATRANNRQVIDRIDLNVQALVHTQMIKALTKLANDVLEYAQERHEFKNRTFNAEDSYGYAIYYRGGILVKTLSSPKATQLKQVGGKVISGHQTAEDFLNNYNAPNGYSLVVVAGVPYAADLEDTFGLDVLTGSYNLARSSFEDVFRQVPLSNSFNRG